MPFPSFSSWPIWANLATVTVAGAVIWLVGTRLTAIADVLADRTGLGRAFIGLVLLAGATSLPEVGTTVTASLAGSVPLAVNNIFGGIAMQTAILALADLSVARGALTYFAPQAVLLLEGVGLILLLALALAGLAAGPLVVFFGVDLWTVLLLATYLAVIYLLKNYRQGKGWQAVNAPERPQSSQADTGRRQYGERSTGRLLLLFAGGAAVLLAAGWTVALASDALARQTGLGASFVGATLVAIATSLPEVSTTIAAVRLGSYSLAVSNIFGSNAFMMALLFLSDVLYRQGSITQAVDRSSAFAATAGIIVTAVYVMGMIVRKNLVILRMGLDSTVVLVLYLASVVVLYLLR